MGRIFLSYAHEDKAKADRIAQALEAAGHSVWWDRHVGAGARFGAEIDKALKQAELVIVLWSARSVESAWVLDEAAAGRDSGRLIPVALDASDIPLGFRQYQAFDLKGRALTATELARLTAVTDARLGSVAARPEPVPVVPPKRDRLRWLAAAGVILLLTIAAIFLRGPSRGGDGSTIAIAAATPESEVFARAVAADLGRYRVGPLAALVFVRPSGVGAGRGDYRIELEVAGADADQRAVATLIDARADQQLWTETVGGDGTPNALLRRRIAAKIGSMLGCLIEARAAKNSPEPEVLGLFLTGCAIGEINEAAISSFRGVTLRAPDFAAGWANLALLEAWSVPTAPPPEQRPLMRRAGGHLDRAKALEPTLPEVYVADSIIGVVDPLWFGRALGLLDEAAKRHPDSALVQGSRAELLRKIGRMRESVTAAKRAVELDPLAVALAIGQVDALAYSGRINAAMTTLREAEAMWPGAEWTRDARYRLALRYGDPTEARRMLVERGAADPAAVPADRAWLAFVDARAKPTAANIDAALAAFRERHRRDPVDIIGYIQALGTFGKVDEAYAALANPVSIDALMGGTEALFRPHMRALRKDPRFIGLAKRLGLLRTWQTSGVWADFCAEPDLPYDCKAEAAKLR